MMHMTPPEAASLACNICMDDKPFDTVIRPRLVSRTGDTTPAQHDTNATKFATCAPCLFQWARSSQFDARKAVTAAMALDKKVSGRGWSGKVCGILVNALYGCEQGPYSDLVSVFSAADIARAVSAAAARGELQGESEDRVIHDLAELIAAHSDSPEASSTSLDAILGHLVNHAFSDYMCPDPACGLIFSGFDACATVQCPSCFQHHCFCCAEFFSPDGQLVHSHTSECIQKKFSLPYPEPSMSQDQIQQVIKERRDPRIHYIIRRVIGAINEHLPRGARFSQREVIARASSSEGGEPAPTTPTTLLMKTRRAHMNALTRKIKSYKGSEKELLNLLDQLSKKGDPESYTEDDGRLLLNFRQALSNDRVMSRASVKRIIDDISAQISGALSIDQDDSSSDEDNGTERPLDLRTMFAMRNAALLGAVQDQAEPAAVAGADAGGTAAVVQDQAEPAAVPDATPGADAGGTDAVVQDQAEPAAEPAAVPDAVPDADAGGTAAVVEDQAEPAAEPAAVPDADAGGTAAVVQAERGAVPDANAGSTAAVVQAVTDVITAALAGVYGGNGSDPIQNQAEPRAVTIPGGNTGGFVCVILPMTPRKRSRRTDYSEVMQNPGSRKVRRRLFFADSEGVVDGDGGNGRDPTAAVAQDQEAQDQEVAVAQDQAEPPRAVADDVAVDFTDNGDNGGSKAVAVATSRTFSTQIRRKALDRYPNVRQVLMDMYTMPPGL